jgi:hypothetical protein
VKDADLALIRVPTAEIKHIDRRQLSVMPEGLLQSMTQQDAADLIELTVQEAGIRGTRNNQLLSKSQLAQGC